MLQWDNTLKREFFLLRAARVPKGPGQFALQSAYHDPHLDVNELKQQIKNRFVQAKTCRIKQITRIIDTLKREKVRWFLLTSPIPSKSFIDMSLHVHCGGLMRRWWKGYRPRVRSHCESPKVPSSLLVATAWKRAVAINTLGL